MGGFITGNKITGAERVVGNLWIWLAMDVGSRDEQDAKGLWKVLPGVYRQCAVCYTDFWKSYQGVIPAKQRKAVGKESGKINRIERFNCTLRQRVSRLVRKTLSFSKKLENHLRVICYFIHHYCFRTTKNQDLVLEIPL